MASLGKFQGQCQSFLGGFLYYAGLKSEHGLKETVESLNFGFWMTLTYVVGRVVIKAWDLGSSTENSLRPCCQGIDFLMKFQ